MGAAAAPLSIAATGLSAFGKISAGDTAAANDTAQAQNALMQAENAYGSAANARAQAYETSQGDTYKAQTLSDSAEYGRVSAAQTAADLQLQLADKLAGYATTRGAAGLDTKSPTGFALANRTEEVADEDRQQRVGNIMAQVGQDQQGAAYYMKAGTDALAIGKMQAEQYKQNAAAYEQQASTYYGNASTDTMTGWLGAGGVALGGLAGPQVASPLSSIKLPTGF